MINGSEHKMCSICEEWFLCSVEFFYKSKTNKLDGVSPYCKSCEKIKNRKYAVDNPEKSKTYQLKQSQNPSPERSEYKRKDNQRRLKSGQYYEWLKSSPEKAKIYRDKTNSKKHKITPKEWDNCRMYFNFRCAYCNKTWEQNKVETRKDLHREHVVHNGKNDLSNCVPACRDCNSSKWEFEFEDWYSDESNINYSEERKIKILKWMEVDFNNFINT